MRASRILDWESLARAAMSRKRASVASGRRKAASLRRGVEAVGVGFMLPIGLSFGVRLDLAVVVAITPDDRQALIFRVLLFVNPAGDR